ncbi:hypothetical protein OQA88_6921 [Cercophora sp. LCS_1]
MTTAVIEISDDDDAPAVSSSKTLGKRKPASDFEEKVAWTDDEDEETEELKRRAKSKRRATEKEKRQARGRPPGKSSGSSKPQAKPNKAIKTEDDFGEAVVPDYLRERRLKFNSDRKRLREAGLKLPPDYSDVYFSDDERRPAQLDQRPKFDAKSGVKPSRAHKKIELKHSAGVVPASIAQYLRDYQIEGAKFLHERFVYQTGCILGDDMGLGKTIQVIAFLTAAFGKSGDERDGKRMRKMRRVGAWYPKVLIICPGSLLQNWKNELERWGWWHVEIFHGAGREDVLRAAKAGRTEIMITTYVTYKKSHEAVNEVEWDCVVADECHAIKDRKSEVTQTMDQLNAMCRIGLTGTAIQNRYEELWTLLNWTNPGQFGSLAEWNDKITKPLKIGQSHDATLQQLSLARVTAKKLVQNLLPNFFLRRMKTLIAHQLPKKSDKVVFCPLTELQREAYESLLESPTLTILKTVSEPCMCGSKRKRGWCCFKNLPDGRPWIKVMFPSILTLQKIANHLTLLIPSSTDPTTKQKTELETLKECLPETWEDLYRNRDSMLTLANPEFCGKWKILRKLLRLWHENGDKVLVFSHSVRLLRILQHLFHNTSYNVSFLDGSLPYEDRQRVVDDFNADPNQFVFLISTKAGGVGLNITSANKVVIFDPHWNPAYDLQAQDRAYRIGQTRDVDVFRLVSAGTIEEIVYARQIYKQQQANIGYNASNERRYFKGVQADKTRKGEIFGLANLFSFHADQVVLREIVNKTNVAEAKVGVSLSEIDLAKAEEDEELRFIKQEDVDDDDGGMSQLAKLLTAENQEEVIKSSKTPKSDAIAAILAGAGVEYTHENSEVIGTSKVEAQLSKKAEEAGNRPLGLGDDSALFADDDEEEAQAEVEGREDWKAKMHYKFNPPQAVMKRQFCSMAKEFGFANATDFALVVENWTQEQRRNCLEAFYRAREVKFLENELAKLKAEVSEKGGGIGDPEMNKEVADVVREEPQEVEVKEEEEEAIIKREAQGGGVSKVSDRRPTTIFLSDDDEDDEL